MCGSVRGVGAGGIISAAFCCMYKLLTLRPTRKQIMTMIKYKDAPYVRAIGLLYVRYTQPPDQLWSWFSRFLMDEESFSPACGLGPSSGRSITIGAMCRQLLTKLDWFTALFPRIPVAIQKEIQARLEEYDAEHGIQESGGAGDGGRDSRDEQPRRQQESMRQGVRESRDHRRSRDDGDSHRRRQSWDRNREEERDDERRRRRSRSRSPVEKRRSSRERSRSRERHPQSSKHSRHHRYD